MPQSRKRQGHTYQKPADIPASQRTTGHLLLALLFGAFGLLIAFFASGSDAVAIAIGALGGAALGWFVGRKMEQGRKTK